MLCPNTALNRPTQVGRYGQDQKHDRLYQITIWTSTWAGRSGGGDDPGCRKPRTHRLGAGSTSYSTWRAGAGDRLRPRCRHRDGRSPDRRWQAGGRRCLRRDAGAGSAAQSGSAGTWHGRTADGVGRDAAFRRSRLRSGLYDQLLPHLAGYRRRCQRPDVC